METQTVDTKFIAAVYTLGAIIILVELLIWSIESTEAKIVLGVLEFLCVVSGAIMAFNKKTRASRHKKKILWFFSIMLAQALVAIGVILMFVISFGNGLNFSVFVVLGVFFAARALLIASASLLILKLHSTNENEQCPRIHFVSRIMVGIAGFVGVISRSLYILFFSSLIELPFTITSWICIGCIPVGILLGYVLKVKKTETKIIF